MNASASNGDNLSPIISMTNRRAKTKERPNPYVLVNLVDSVVSISNYAAVAVVRERGCDVNISETLCMHGYPMDCNDSQQVNSGKSFLDSKPTPCLTFRNARELSLSLKILHALKLPTTSLKYHHEYKRRAI